MAGSSRTLAAVAMLAVVVAAALAIAAGVYVLFSESGVTMASTATAAIVLIGTVAGVLIGRPPGGIGGAVSAIRPAFTAQPAAAEILEPLVRAARVARRQGLMSLEEVPGAHPFAAEALGLAADGVASDSMRQLLDARLRTLRRGDEAPAVTFEFAAATALSAGAIAAGLAALAIRDGSTPRLIERTLGGRAASERSELRDAAA